MQRYVSLPVFTPATIEVMNIDIHVLKSQCLGVVNYSHWKVLLSSINIPVDNSLTLPLNLFGDRTGPPARRVPPFASLATDQSGRVDENEDRSEEGQSGVGGGFVAATSSPPW